MRIKILVFCLFSVFFMPAFAELTSQTTVNEADELEKYSVCTTLKTGKDCYVPNAPLNSDCYCTLVIHKILGPVFYKPSQLKKLTEKDKIILVPGTVSWSPFWD